MRFRLTPLLVAISLAVAVAPAASLAPRPCQAGDCGSAACRTDLDCPRGCVCSEDMDEDSRGACVPTSDPL